MKKPEKKVDAADDNTSVTVKKSAEDTKDHVDSKPVEKETPKEAHISNPPAIKTDSAEEGITCTTRRLCFLG